MPNFYKALILLTIVSIPLSIKADPFFWPDFNANILMPQIGLGASSGLLEPSKPAIALYSIGNSNNSTFNPEYLQEAVLGIEWNDSSAFKENTINGLSAPVSVENSVGGGCYLGGFGGIAGTGTNSGGGGSFFYYASSSNYSMGGMGFGSGGGGDNPPPDTPPNEPPTQPPPTTPPVIYPEPATWLTLAGALFFVLIWKRKSFSRNRSSS